MTYACYPKYREARILFTLPRRAGKNSFCKTKNSIDLASKMAKDKPKRVAPTLLKGFRDYPPDQQIAREKMISTLRDAVELMGFLPLQTASLESANVLLGSHYSKDALQELFGFQGPDDVDMALRYEFTLSLARFVAADPNLALPFRRYQYGNVWRVDKPGPGRFREFMQFDIDIVGTQNLLADTEIIAAMVTTLNRLRVKNFKVRYSNRKILNGLIKWAGIESERGPEVMRVIDKLEKQGKEAVLLELGPGRIDVSGDKIAGLNLSDEQIRKVAIFLEGAAKHQISRNESEIQLSSGSYDTAHLPAISFARELLHNDVAIEGLNELEQIHNTLGQMGIDRNKTIVDLTIVRGLGYYTGPVFETTLLDLPEFGSVFSGGRYDNLVDRFLGRSIPAVGSSIGIDRLLAALIELKAVELTSSTSKVLVTVMDRERLSDYLAIVSELRKAGIPCEIYSGETKNLSKQVKYGDKVGIPFVVIAGSDEFAAGQVTVKNLAAGRRMASDTADREEWLAAEGFQETISRAELVDYLKRKLA
jgi:histidyl-tRNA synthetase